MSDSAEKNLGPHLLGRVPNEPDSRDFRSSALLTASPLDIALAKLVANKSVAPATKEFAKAVTQAVNALNPNPPPPPPPPPAPSGDVVWKDTKQLDQGQTGHCVGFGWAQWGNTEPVTDSFANADGHAVYYEAKVIDGQPGQENGSQVRSGAKAMQNRKRNSVYAFAATLDDVKTWVRAKGPVVIGSDWFNDMFNPDAQGFVKPTGSLAGGHCYLLVGDLASEGAFLFQNSWGANWGKNGYFKVKYADFQKLLDNYGDACVSLELAL